MSMWLRHLYAWACERLYAEWAWSYNSVSWLVSLGWWARWRALALDYVQGPRVLEIGFGTGGLLSPLAARARLTVGLDLSSAMHQQAAHTLTQAGLTLPLVQARAQAMPFADQAFDTLIATFPATYILEPVTLAECARLLAVPVPVAVPTPTRETGRGGRLVIVGLWVGLARARWERLLPLFYGRPPQASLQRLAALLTAAGFCPTLAERAVGPFRVGVVIAERREAGKP